MKLARLLSGDAYKGEKHYLRNQRNYELAKTIIMFAIAIGLFVAGLIINKGNKANIFTIVAVLGCLPACKCLVELIMFIRYKTCNDELADKIENSSDGLIQAYDRVFTSKEKTQAIDHLVVNNNSLCCYTSAKKFSESDFQKHIAVYLKAENIKDTTIKVFTEEKKYLERISNMSPDNNTEKDKEILNVLLNISL
ncbi:MAG: hypothetical protein MJ104_03210 [Lachnospiraceae bacterium]|nr:hypothetical protein [Lachnospiraceae bacterium]